MLAKVNGYIDLKEFHYEEQCKKVKNLIEKANVSFDIENSVISHSKLQALSQEKLQYAEN